MVEKIEINLIPQEYRVKTRRFTIKKDILIPILVSLALFTSMLMWNAFLVGRIASEKFETMQIESEIRENAHVQIEIETLGREQREKETKIAGLEQIDVVRDKWVRLLELYCREIPDNTWLTGLTESGSIIKIKGQTSAFGEVGQFMVQLTEDSLVSSVALLEVRQGGAGNLMSFSIDQQLAPSMLSAQATRSDQNN